MNKQANPPLIVDNNIRLVREAIKTEIGTAFQKFEDRNDQKMFDLRSDVASTLQKFEDRNDQKMFDLRSDVGSMKDEIVGELKTVREEQVLLTQRTTQINQVDDRLEKLEKIHPSGRHATVQ